MSEYDYSNYLAESGLDKSLWARFDEAKKALKTVKCCNKLQWGGPDANEVAESLFIGNHQAAQSISYLNSLGITHLLNCAHPLSGPEAAISVPVDCDELKEANISYLGLQLADESSQEISPEFERSGQWIQDALATPGNKVLVNCWAGISRSSTVTIAFLMRHREMNLVAAIRQVKSMRDINPNYGFLKQLVVFESNL